MEISIPENRPIRKSYIICFCFLQDLIESGNKFLCFAHHATMMNTIADTLNDAQVHFIRIDGGTSSSMRKTYCDAFQTDDNVRSGNFRRKL